MKSKNIPVDIKEKSIKEAQIEIGEILERLENKEAKLEDLQAQYDRMMQLNNHIQERFRQQAKEIKQSFLQNSKKNSSKQSK